MKEVSVAVSPNSIILLYNDVKYEIRKRRKNETLSESLQHIINIVDYELSRDDQIKPLVDNDTVINEVAEHIKIIANALHLNIGDFDADILPLD